MFSSFLFLGLDIWTICFKKLVSFLKIIWWSYDTCLNLSWFRFLVSFVLGCWCSVKSCEQSLSTAHFCKVYSTLFLLFSIQILLYVTIANMPKRFLAFPTVFWLLATYLTKCFSKLHFRRLLKFKLRIIHTSVLSTFLKWAIILLLFTLVELYENIFQLWVG